MIDIHHHCLPGVDDGPQTHDEAIAQCRLAFSEGIETIVATPHVLRGEWQNDSPGRLHALVDSLNATLRGKPSILLGSEYFFAHDILERLDQSDAIVPLAGGRYVLIEFPHSSVPQLVEEVFYQLQLRRRVPVIAHPERNIVFQAKPRLLRSLIAKGAKTQVTATSLLGKFGQEAKEASLRWLDAGMVHFLATDAHNAQRRGPAMAAAIEEVTGRWGAERVEALTQSNPRAVIANDDLPYDPEPVEQKAPAGFFDAARKFWNRGMGK